MNIFRLLGDLAHVASKCILIWSIHKNKSAEGISFLTQAMYAFVFPARFLDPFFFFNLTYDTVLNILYIASAFYILVVMLLLLLLSNYDFTLTPIEILWSFSIVLEALCIIPQLILIRETATPTVITSSYLLALGAYRALYIPTWIYRHFDPTAIVFGVIHTAFYLDFAWVYYTRQRIKLRDGVLLVPEDQRGWSTRWLSGNADPPLQPSLNSGSAVLPDEGALEEGRIVSPTEEAEEGRIALPPDAETPEGALEQGRITLPTEEGRIALPTEEERIASPPDEEAPARAAVDNASA
ncbi:hypothetical protein MSAN_00093300 [Mycena sanguinolenta]|uniref:ER lumen protein-retaining receptor n=1 Tax=Mycena sanguinolenta TaxID=230812 RepID=A0A8H6ZJP7_9AGAR|nr:hypothetical protein MSAN_00093300 [Mycena sanguinolenta]